MLISSEAVNSVVLLFHRKCETIRITVQGWLSNSYVSSLYVTLMSFAGFGIKQRNLKFSVIPNLQDSAWFLTQHQIYKDWLIALFLHFYADHKEMMKRTSLD